MKVDAWTLRRNEARAGLALDQRARPVQIPRAGAAQHQGGRHRRRRLRRDPERLDRHRSRWPHAVEHRARSRRSLLRLRHRSRSARASRSGTRSKIRIHRTASACGTRAPGRSSSARPRRQTTTRSRAGSCGDIDPALPGMECWGDKFFFSAQGRLLHGPVPPQNELVWWDADPLREIHARRRHQQVEGRRAGPAPRAACSTSPISLGDWREEIVTFADGALRIYSTLDPGARPPRHA